MQTFKKQMENEQVETGDVDTFFQMCHLEEQCLKEERRALWVCWGFLLLLLLFVVCFVLFFGFSNKKVLSMFTG